MVRRGHSTPTNKFVQSSRKKTVKNHLCLAKGLMVKTVGRFDNKLHLGLKKLLNNRDRLGLLRSPKLCKKHGGSMYSRALARTPSV